MFAAIDHYILRTEDFGFTWDTLTKLEFANFTWGLANVKDTLLHSTYFQGMYKWDASAEVLTQCNTGLTKGSIWELEMSNDKIWTAGSTGIYNYDLNSGEWSNKMNLPEPYWPYQYNRMASNDLGWVAITNYLSLIHIFVDLLSRRIHQPRDDIGFIHIPRTADVILIGFGRLSAG